MIESSLIRCWFHAFEYEYFDELRFNAVQRYSPFVSLRREERRAVMLLPLTNSSFW